MILAIDVGNTNIVLGGIEDGKQLFSVPSPATGTRPPTSTPWTFRGS